MARWRRILVFPITRIILCILGAALLGVVFDLVGVPVLRWLRVPEPAKPLESLAAIVALVLLVRFVERRSLKEAGLGATGMVRDTAAGFLMGTVIMSMTIGAMALAGVYRVQGVQLSWAALGFGLWHYLWVGVLEEVLIRGVVFRILEEWLGSWIALGASALLFGLLHLINPNASVFAALAIAAEAGILLGAAYMLTRNLWLAIGIHWAWNFCEGPVFGTSVSGGPAWTGLLRPTIEGPFLWTGGGFGPEASLFALLIATAAGVAMVAAAARRGHVVSRKTQVPA